MKKYIEGKRYDTDTAKCLVSLYENMGDTLNQVEESLYVKTSGEYFLHGRGGPNSRYREFTGPNSWTGGERLIRISLNDARGWVERNFDGETYEKIFGVIDEDDAEPDERRKSLLLWLPDEIYTALNEKKNESGVSVTALIVMALKDAGYGA